MGFPKIPDLSEMGEKLEETSQQMQKLVEGIGRVTELLEEQNTLLKERT